MAVVPTVYAQTATVEQMLVRAGAAISPPALAAWMNSTMTPYVQQRAKERFRREGDNASGKWKQLSPITKDFRAIYGFPPGPINRRTGELEAYITGSPSRVTMTNIGVQMVYPGVAAGGWLEEKVKTAQAGKDDPKTDARPVLALDPSTDLMFTLRSLAEWVHLYISRGKAPRGMR
jgi:hypothetical protein